MRDVDSFLEHYGVMGMKWGVRQLKVNSLNKKIKNVEKNTQKQKRYIKNANKTYGRAEDVFVAKQNANYQIKFNEEYSKYLNTRISDIKKGGPIFDDGEKRTAATLAIVGGLGIASILGGRYTSRAKLRRISKTFYGHF